MGWFEDTVTWCAGGPWMFTALLFPGRTYPMAGHQTGGNWQGRQNAREAGPLFKGGHFFGTRTWFASTLAAPECSLITLTQTELVAYSAEFDVSGQIAAAYGSSEQVGTQGLKKVGQELARWPRSDVTIELSFHPQRLQASQRLIVGDQQIPSKVIVHFANRSSGETSIMNSFTSLTTEQRAEAWTDRSVSGGNWTNDFVCFADWWAKNPEIPISS